MAATSEQELKTLLDEGKITQEEYQELLAAMKDKPRPNGASLTPDNKSLSKAKMGKTSLILFIISLVLPWFVMILSYWLTKTAGHTIHSNVGAIFVFLLIITEFTCGCLAFIFGIIAWKTIPGKIVVAGSVLIGLPVILLFVLQIAYNTSMNVSTIYMTYSCDSLDSLIVGQTGSPVENGIFSEDNNTIKIQVLQPDTFRLYETGPLHDASDTMLFYQAKIKSEALSGKAYLELWCSLPGKGEFFSRGLDQTISGTNNWTTMQIPFRNDSGISPDNIKLNLVVQGTGTIWIDDIQVTGQSL